MRKFGIVVSLAWIIIVFTSAGTVQADWASRFVVYEGNTYSISDQPVEPSSIGSRLGKVTSYSDKEGIYSGHFSNYYPVGTEYYTINRTAILNAIAVKVSDELFIQANYEGEYGGSVINWNKTWGYLACSFVVAMAGLFVWNNWKQSGSHHNKNN